MGQRMYVCAECGMGYLGLDSCPACHPQGDAGEAEIHIPWVRTSTGWAQRRIDGSTWELAGEGAVPAAENLADIEARTCQNGNHTFAGTEGSSCPICGPDRPRQDAATAHQGRAGTRWMRIAYAVLLLFVVAVIVAVVAVTSNNDSNPVAVETTTTSTEAPTTTTVPPEDPEFANAVTYENELTEIGRRAERSTNRVLEINAQWDSKEITQDVASSQLATQRRIVDGIVAAVDDAAGFGASEVGYVAVADAAQELADAVAAVRDGLLEPGSRAGRDEATLWTIAATDQLLQAIDDALDLDRHRVQRDEGTLVLWESLRVGDCVDAGRQGTHTEIVSCSRAGRGEVLATPLLPSGAEATPAVCSKAALPFVDFERFGATDGSWAIRGGVAQGSDTTHICTYVPETQADVLAVRNTPHTGPFASDQWEALARLDLALSPPVEVGQCFVVPPDDESELVSQQSRVDCDDEHDFSLSAVVAVAPPGGAAALDRLNLRSWDVCAESVSVATGGDSYLVADASVYPSYPGFDNLESPMLTLACAFRSNQLDGGEAASFAYQSGYVFAFITAQAGVYDFGLVENPQSEEDTQYNEGFHAGQADVQERRSPTTEVTNTQWIDAYLRGNPTGWVDGRGCTRPSPYPVPPGMDEIDTDGWYAGYNAGFDSACNAGTAAPSWVGESVCPYDPWAVHAIDQDVICPPVRP